MTPSANGHRPAQLTDAVATTDELIDLLADDALDAPRRAALLRSFDDGDDNDATNRDGWRRCALALLEAQAWRRAMGDLPVTVGSAPVAPPARVERRRGFPRLAAAAVLAAFTVGTLFGGAAIWSHRPRVGGATSSGGASQAARPSGATAAVRNEVAMDVPGSASRALAVPDYMRRQLEREGYEVQGAGARMIPIELADGRTVTVPVATLTYQYVGRRVR